MKLWLKKIGFGLREIVALAIWLLIITKLFVYDVDLLLVQRVGWLRRFYPYKFFFIIAVVAAVWLVLGGKYARRIILFVAAYPFVLLWRLLFKNWATLLLFAPALESLARTFKWRFILSSFALSRRLRNRIAHSTHGVNDLYGYCWNLPHFSLRLSTSRCVSPRKHLRQCRANNRIDVGNNYQDFRGG